MLRMKQYLVLNDNETPPVTPRKVGNPMQTLHAGIYTIYQSTIFTPILQAITFRVYALALAAYVLHALDLEVSHILVIHYINARI